MIDWWSFVRQDMALILSALESRDFIYPMSCLLMLMIFFMPLRGIDRRDFICGLIYTVYIIAAGTILFFAVPGVGTGFTALGLHFAFVASLGSAALYRWFHSNDHLVVVAKNPPKTAADRAVEPVEAPSEKL